jgi:hypothetical protein
MVAIERSWDVMMLLSASSDLIRGRVANERSVQVCCTLRRVQMSLRWYRCRQVK